MKLFSIAVSILLMISCSKSQGPNNNNSKASYLKMKINGNLKEYDSCWVSGFSQTSGSLIYYQWNIKGGVPGDYGGVYVNDSIPISVKKYLSTDLNSAVNTPKGGLGAYRPKGTNDIYISYQAGWPLYDVVVEITSINDDYVTGNFHGKMRLVGGDSILNVTDGEFKALK